MNQPHIEVSIVKKPLLISIIAHQFELQANFLEFINEISCSHQMWCQNLCENVIDPYVINYFFFVVLLKNTIKSDVLNEIARIVELKPQNCIYNSKIKIKIMQTMKNRKKLCEFYLSFFQKHKYPHQKCYYSTICRNFRFFQMSNYKKMIFICFCLFAAVYVLFTYSFCFIGM